MAGPVPAHVWVRRGGWEGAPEDPGLLVAWERRGVEWWGLVAMVTDGEPGLFSIRADRLRPVNPGPVAPSQ